NPSFELNSALLSRCQVVVFDKLSDVAVTALVERSGVIMSDELKQFVVMIADGDGRAALNTVELLHRSYGDLTTLTRDQAKAAIEKVALRYDKAGEEHYNI
ncbi:MAG TPA: AAA family ATPase, partial [Candidatus Kerfeldbacteria bacterium]|nr:AAA family ATPase [Candidatus Kerfeldbacteria bacterium]